jgi:hypothetical protein
MYDAEALGSLVPDDLPGGRLAAVSAEYASMLMTVIATNRFHLSALLIPCLPFPQIFIYSI